MKGLELINNSALNCPNHEEINDDLQRVPPRIAAVQNGNALLSDFNPVASQKREVIVVTNVMESRSRENSTGLQGCALDIGQQITNLE